MYQPANYTLKTWTCDNVERTPSNHKSCQLTHEKENHEGNHCLTGIWFHNKVMISRLLHHLKIEEHSPKLCLKNRTISQSPWKSLNKITFSVSRTTPPQEATCWDWKAVPSQFSLISLFVIHHSYFYEFCHQNLHILPQE